MISQTSEDLTTATPPGPGKPPKQSPKPRKVAARTFDFLWRGDSRRGSALKTEEGQQRREDLVEVRIVDCKAKNALPSKTSFNFFKNIKRHMQARKLAICKPKQKVNETQASSPQDDTNCDSLVLQDDGPTISMEEADSSESRCDGIVDTSVYLSNNETSASTETCSQSEWVSESQNEWLENCSNSESNVGTINSENVNEVQTDSNSEHVPITYQSCSNNEEQQSNHNSMVENEGTEHRIGNSQENTEAYETINNENKVKASLTEELLKLSNYGWYWGPISGSEADAKLISEPDGAFLVRDSSDDRYLLTLSFKSSGKLLHARMEHSRGLFSLCNQSESEVFSSVADLIDFSMNFSQSAVFCYSRPRYPGQPAFPVRLTKPVSRFTQVRSLQYLCRFVIRQNTRVDNIHKLPLPTTIKGYIEEAHY
ncbi:uncharacterized protein LOC143374749 [Andrena cerasifolii]|uniref:uncharacterized protein LOC143374749 n=1 Tax=Andrena cerasifolii TaxID=2819439 RepID=UPI004037E6C5